ncbi:MAG: hypothetical protein IKT60_05945 [Clostridia bacterium]|nr:hypothetical protein [Clostridia bacterium]
MKKSVRILTGGALLILLLLLLPACTDAPREETVSFAIFNESTRLSATVTYSEDEPDRAEWLTVRNLDSGREMHRFRLADNRCFTTQGIFLEDINLDGMLDILLPHRRDESAVYFQAFMWNSVGKGYVYTPSFQNVPNCNVVKSLHRLQSTITEDGLTEYSLWKYDTAAQRFIRTRSVTWEESHLPGQMSFRAYRWEIFGVGEKSVLTEYIETAKTEDGIDLADSALQGYAGPDAYFRLRDASWQAEDVFWKKALKEEKK